MIERAFRADARVANGLHDGSISVIVRVVDPQPEEGTDCPYHVGKGKDRVARRSPFGVVGDRLWVQEEYCKGEYFTEEGELWYRARPEDEHCFNEGEGSACDSGWHPAEEMPQWASRTILDVTDVRVVRAQEVAEKDAKATGLCPLYKPARGYDEDDDAGPSFALALRRLYGEDKWLWLATVAKVENKPLAQKPVEA